MAVETHAEESTALSPKEQALWLFEQYTADGVGVHNVAFALRFHDRIRWWPMQTALRHLIRRHAALRTVFPAVDGAATRVVLDADDPRCAVKLTRIAATPDGLASDLRGFAGPAFELDGGPLLRAAMFTGAEREVFCAVVDHLVFDASSAGVLRDELMALYQALSASGSAPAELTDPGPVYREPPPSPADLRYWHEHLAGAAATARPVALSRGGRHRHGYTGRTVAFRMSPMAAAAVDAVAAELRVTHNIVLLAAYYVLLARHGAGDDIVVGLPIDVRDPGARRAIGFHINVVRMRGRLRKEDTFADLVHGVRHTFLMALRHSRATMDEVLPGSYLGDGDSAGPLFRYMFNYVPPTGAMGYPEAELLPVPPESSWLDLTLNVLPNADGKDLEVTFSDEVFAEDEVAALVARYEALVVDGARTSAKPWRQLSMWTDGDRRAVATAPASTAPASTQPATTDGPPRTDRLDAGSLLSPAEQLAGDLIAAAAGAVVAVYARPGEDLVVGLLGSWLAGREVLLLDPDGDVTEAAEACKRAGVRWVVVGGTGAPQALSAGRRLLSAHAPTHRHRRGTADRVPGLAASVRDGDGGPQLPLVRGQLWLAGPGLDSGGVPVGVDGWWTLDATVVLAVGAESSGPGDGPTPDPAVPEVAAADEVSPASEDLAGVLLSLWRDLLGEPTLDAGADFFQHGGTSIDAGRLLARVKKLTGVRLTMRHVFSDPTPAGLASVISNLAE